MSIRLPDMPFYNNLKIRPLCNAISKALKNPEIHF